MERAAILSPMAIVDGRSRISVIEYHRYATSITVVIESQQHIASIFVHLHLYYVYAYNELYKVAL